MPAARFYKRRVIGIDYDEVISDTMPCLLEFVAATRGWQYTPEQIHHHELHEVWGGTREQATGIFMEFYDSHFFDEVKPVAGAIETLELLSREYDFAILTARPLAIESKSAAWLNRHKKDMHFEVYHSCDFFPNGSATKAHLCHSLGAVAMIEDNSKYALDCAQQGIPTLLLDKPWNRNVEEQHFLRRASSWNAIPNLIAQAGATLKNAVPIVVI